MENKYRKALESLWRDRCTIFIRVKETDPVTKLTSFKDAALCEKEPCKLSFETLSAAGAGDAAPVSQVVKLFLCPNLKIPPGCKITVNRYGDPSKEFVFSNSGAAGTFSNHQEIYLTLFKGWC